MWVQQKIIECSDLKPISNFTVSKIFIYDRHQSWSYLELCNPLMIGKEVILAAGAIHPPQILQLSGIGGGDLLRSFGINIIVNLPDVGKITFRIIQSCIQSSIVSDIQ
jgi:hypothetical protein